MLIKQDLVEQCANRSAKNNQASVLFPFEIIHVMLEQGQFAGFFLKQVLNLIKKDGQGLSF